MVLRKVSDGNGGHVTAVSLPTYISTVGILVAVIATMAGALWERATIVDGLATDAELNTMAAGLKQGIDAALDDIEKHERIPWHPGAGERHAESMADRAALHAELLSLRRRMERYHQ